MFYQGQRVVAQKVSPRGFSLNNKCPEIIDGKSYYVSNPNIYQWEGLVFIAISGIDPYYNYWQGCFIPYDADAKLEEQIFDAMKGIKIEN